MGFSLGGAISSATSWVGSKVEGAVEEGGEALKSAQTFVGDRLDDIDHAKDWVGGKIDGAVTSAEHGIDDFRHGLVQFGEDHGGFVGKALAENVSNSLGVVEGAGLAVYDMGKGVVQLADGASKLVNPLEWATHGDRNLQRLETVGKVGETLGNLTSPVAWATHPSENIDTAKALWNGVTAGYQDAASQGDWSKFIGRGVVDVGSLFLGVGEANAALKGAEGASAVAKLGEGANVVEHAAQGARALEGANDVAKAADGVRALDGAADAAKATTAATDAAKAAGDYGVAFFGDSNLGYYTVDAATIGRDGKPFFFMPLEDSGIVRNAADAARYTGRAPSAEKAFLEGTPIYGLSFPLEGKAVRLPTAADAGGWPHFLEGGHTAVALPDGGGFLVNPTREFVMPGGAAVPPGSVLFKLGEGGSWTPLRAF